MTILIATPPNFQKIDKKFHPNPNVVFTYGDTLYNPGNGFISKDLLVHEKTHTQQQGDDPEGWWDKYIADAGFRLKQEVEAYRNQYKDYCGSLGHIALKVRVLRVRDFLHKISSDLSGPIYGHMVNFDQALDLIREGKN